MCFSKLQKKKDGLYSICKLCKRAYDNKWYLTSSISHKDKRKKRAYVHYINVKKWIYTYLKIHPCVICGEADPPVLDFDHLDKKNFNISSCGSLKRIQKEILLCQVLCANCHRRKTAKQFGWYSSFLGVGEFGTPPDLESGSTGSNPVT